MNEKTLQNPLGTQPIGRLMARFAVPCIISLVVNALYNIVDQIFIGWGVGYLGNGATNVVFPLTVIALAFALLIGDGGAAWFSLKLGAGERDKAQKGVANALTLLIIAGVAIFALTSILLRPLCQLFGATEVIMPYALEYGGIITIGLPFVIIGTGLNSIIRADGSPKYAMFSMILGAVINTILDPVFIFVFDMGVQGAAIATVIGQVASFAVSVAYLPRFKNLRITRKDMRLNRRTTGRVLSLGVSSFINQAAITVVMGVTNNMLIYYGAQSVYGAEIPLTALGIVMKVNQIMIAVLIGIATGAQPIIGYNYGAGNRARVMKTYKIAVIAASAFSVACFLCFTLLPEQIVLLFGSGEALYMEFAVKCFRIFLCLCAFTGFQKVSAIFLQSIGRPVQSAAISLARQVICLVPAAIILPLFLGVEGVLWAGPLADGLALVLTVVIMIVELRRLKKLPDRSPVEEREGQLSLSPSLHPSGS